MLVLYNSVIRALTMCQKIDAQLGVGLLISGVLNDDSDLQTDQRRIKYIFNYLKIQLKSSQLAVFYLDTHGLAGPADLHFVDFKPGCDIPCAFARESSLDQRFGNGIF